MKTLLVGLSLLLSGTMASANQDVTKSCKAEAERILSVEMLEPVVVNLVLEVGPGTYDVDHLVIFSLPNTGGVAYKAIMKATVGECRFSYDQIEDVLPVYGMNGLVYTPASPE
ncbi:hypothetical protein D3C72_1393450 [compost metagenome]